VKWPQEEEKCLEDEAKIWAEPHNIRDLPVMEQKED